MKKWKVEAVLDTDTASDFAKRREGVMNSLEAEGFEVREPKPIGKHYFVYGRTQTGKKGRTSVEGSDS